MKITKTATAVKACTTALAAIALLCLGGCVNDELYHAPTITANWTNRGEGVDIPESWTIEMGEYTGTETGNIHIPDYPFDAGSYTLVAYNIPDSITVSGTTATVDSVADGYISGTPGWLFTCVQNVEIENYTYYTLTATMQQQVRQLTVIIDPASLAADLIESIEGSLSGVASTLDFATGTHSTPSNVALSFTQITEGDDAGKWSATVRLLGVAGDTQTLTATIAYTGGEQQNTPLDENLTAVLADFNTKKTVHLTLMGSIEISDEANFSTTVIDWTTDDNYSGDNNGEAVME